MWANDLWAYNISTRAWALLHGTPSTVAFPNRKFPSFIFYVLPKYIHTAYLIGIRDQWIWMH
jgi:hypothetical protein